MLRLQPPRYPCGNTSDKRSQRQITRHSRLDQSRRISEALNALLTPAVHLHPENALVLLQSPNDAARALPSSFGGVHWDPRWKDLRDAKRVYERTKTGRSHDAREELHNAQWAAAAER